MSRVRVEWTEKIVRITLPADTVWSDFSAVGNAIRQAAQQGIGRVVIGATEVEPGKFVQTAFIGNLMEIAADHGVRLDVSTPAK